MSGESTPVVGLDPAEALELSELCEFMAQWLSQAPPAVTASLNARTGSEGYCFELRDELLRWSQLLVTRGPQS
jgi:hypothetical protein